MQKHPADNYNTDNMCEHRKCNRKWQAMIWSEDRPLFLCADDASYALSLRDERKDKTSFSKFAAECSPLKI